MPKTVQTKTSKPGGSGQQPRMSLNKPDFIVGLGASAGGLEPLQEFFRKISPETNAKTSYVVVQHLSSKHKSVMDQLLERETLMPVNQIKNRQKILPGHIYLIPPGKILRVKDGKFVVTRRKSTKGVSYPIDIFFQSMAEEMKESAIGIIFSGTGSDGSQGLQKIKEQGGLVLVQSVDSAKFDGMPQNALATGMADYELAPTEMIPVIQEYTGHKSLPKNLVKDAVQVTDNLVKILRLLKEVHKIDFHLYKQEMLIRRITRRMHIRLSESLQEYYFILTNDKEELALLFEDLLVGVTRFFRDEEAFEILRNKVIPDLVEKCVTQQIRIWVPGCSSGEEAYSIAILFLECIEQKNKQINLKIFATDINPRALAFGSEGIYPDSISKSVSDEYLSKYFYLKNSRYHVNKKLRESIVFTKHNLLQDAPFNQLDFISCRNLVIYLKPRTQSKLFAVFNFALKSEGALFLGSSEGADNFREIFQPISQKWKIYRSIFQARKPLSGGRIETPKLSSVYTVSERKRQIETTTVFKSRMLDTACEMMVQEFSTAALIIDEQFELIKYFGNAGRYLFVPQEPENWNLLRMMRADAAAAISAGVRKVSATGKKIVYRRMRFELNGEDVFSNLTIKPWLSRHHDQILFLIIMEEEDDLDHSLVESEMPVVNNSLVQRIKDLEHELALSRESHQATIEELQSSNEEMLAANEELQGTNEELQSVNEELYTMNAEHQATIGQLSDLNDDMDNLLRHTHLGVLFLDAQLCIRRFNSSITDEINITSTDIGRPIEHFSSQLHDVDLKKDALNVLNTGKILEKEIYSQSSKWYNFRMLPYQVDEDSPSGIVLTLVDITQIKGIEKLKATADANMRLKNQLEQEREERMFVDNELEQRCLELEAIWDTLPSMYFRLDREGRYLDYRIGRNKMTDPVFSEKEFLGKQIEDFFSPAITSRFLMGIKECLEKQQLIILDLTTEVSGKKQHFELRLKPLNDHEVVAILHEISELKTYQDMLSKNEHLLNLIAEHIPEGGLVIFDDSLICTLVKGKVNPIREINQALPDFLEEADPLLQACKQVFKDKSRTIEWRHDGDFFLAQTMPVHAENGAIYGGIIIFQKITDAKMVQRALRARLKDMEQFAYSVSMTSKRL